MRRGLLTLTLAAVLAACATPSATSDAPPGTGEDVPARPGTPSDTLTGTLTVLAAASLTGTVTELAERFEQLHPALTVRTSFAGSPTLARQVAAGAPADVLVTADRATMAQVADAHAAAPAVLARNTLRIAVPPDDPGRVGSLTDLARPDVLVALCAPEVPCGAAAQELLDATGVTVTPVTLEKDVRAVLTKVRLGEVDAGLVYRTDVAAARGDVVGVPVPEVPGAVTDYLVAPLVEAPNPDAAAAFVTFLLGPDGRGALDAAGFLPP